MSPLPILLLFYHLPWGKQGLDGGGGVRGEGREGREGEKGQQRFPTYDLYSDTSPL